MYDGDVSTYDRVLDKGMYSQSKFRKTLNQRL